MFIYVFKTVTTVEILENFWVAESPRYFQRLVVVLTHTPSYFENHPVETEIRLDTS